VTIPSHISSQSSAEFNWLLLNQKNREIQLSRSIQILQENGVEPIAIKGWTLGRFYPKNDIRGYTDIDIAVDPSIYNFVLELLRSPEFHGLNVDLHSGLRHLDNLPWAELVARSTSEELNGVPIRVLCDEDNLRITSVHWLTDGGVYRDRLKDMYYLVKNRREDFEWERCLNAAGPIRRQWVMVAIATARDFMGLNLDGAPESLRSLILPNWYKRALEREWRRGPYLRIPLWLCIGKPRKLTEQLRRRFPPNPIAATVDVEGPMDDGSRILYQTKNLLKKVRPSVLDIFWRLTRSGESR
jgi:hypothetical protein